MILAEIFWVLAKYVEEVKCWVLADVLLRWGNVGFSLKYLEVGKC